MTDERKILRRQIKKTLEAYKDPDKIAPKLRDSIQDAALDEIKKQQEAYATRESKFEEKYEQMKKDQENWEALKRGKKKGQQKKLPIVPKTPKRKIKLDDI